MKGYYDRSILIQWPKNPDRKIVGGKITESITSSILKTTFCLSQKDKTTLAYLNSNWSLK